MLTAAVTAEATARATAVTAEATTARAAEVAEATTARAAELVLTTSVTNMNANLGPILQQIVLVLYNQ